MGRPFLISWSYARCSWRQKWTRYKHSEVPQHRHLTCFPPHPTVSVITRRVYIHWPSFLSSTSPAPITPSWILVFQQRYHIPKTLLSLMKVENRKSCSYPHFSHSNNPSIRKKIMLIGCPGSLDPLLPLFTFTQHLLSLRPSLHSEALTLSASIPPSHRLSTSPHFRASRMPTPIYIHLIEKPFDTVQNYMQSGMPNHGCLIELCSSQYRKEMNMISLSGMMQVVLGVSIITQNGLTPSAWRTYGRLAFHVWKPQETWRQESQTCCFSR